jgi:hypothetical protein
VPRQEQVCGYQDHQVCVDVSDSPVCHQVPKVDQVCVDHMEKECKNIPTKDVCKNIPYIEQVCTMEARSKDVPYECMKKIQVPHEVIVKTHKANVKMQFDARSPQVETQFALALGTEGALELNAKGANPNIIAFAHKEITQNELANINSISALYKIVLFDRLENFKFMASGIQNIKLQSRALEFTLDGKIEAARIKLGVNISKKGEVKFAKALTGKNIQATFDGGKTTISIDLEKLGAPKLGGIFNRTHNVDLKMKLDYTDLGEVVYSEGDELAVSANVSVKVE